jgi:hypothetical protein
MILGFINIAEIRSERDAERICTSEVKTTVLKTVPLDYSGTASLFLTLLIDLIKLLFKSNGGGR